MTLENMPRRNLPSVLTARLQGRVNATKVAVTAIVIPHANAVTKTPKPDILGCINKEL